MVMSDIFVINYSFKRSNWASRDLRNAEQALFKKWRNNPQAEKHCVAACSWWVLHAVYLSGRKRSMTAYHPYQYELKCSHLCFFIPISLPHEVLCLFTKYFGVCLQESKLSICNIYIKIWGSPKIIAKTKHIYLTPSLKGSETPSTALYGFPVDKQSSE